MANPDPDTNGHADEPAATPAPIPPEEFDDAPEPGPSRPRGVLVLGAIGIVAYAALLALTLVTFLAVLGAAPTVALFVVIGLAFEAFVIYAYWRMIKGDGWARGVALALAWLDLVAAPFALALLWSGGAVTALIAFFALALAGGVFIWYLNQPRVAEWFTPVDSGTAKQDAKWGASLLLLTILGLSGWSNTAWQRAPTGREEIAGIVDALLNPNGLVFLLQVLAILLVAALVGAVVLAMREPEGDETETEAEVF